MFAKLISLHRDGVVLPAPELAGQPTYTGNLVVTDWPDGNVFKRSIRCARLMTVDHSVKVDVVPPLFEPVLIKVTTRLITLHGYQIHTWQGKAVHYAQVWVLQPTVDAYSE